MWRLKTSKNISDIEIYCDYQIVRIKMYFEVDDIIKKKTILYDKKEQFFIKLLMINMQSKVNFKI